jgi:hypothetical protein
LTALGNDIIVWYSDPPGGFTISQADQTVLITRYGTFKIKAVDPLGRPGNIRSITVAGGVLGSVNLHVVSQAAEAGADNLGWVDLSNATVGSIVEIQVAQFLGPDPNDQPTQATAIAGRFVVGGTINKDINVGTLAAGSSLSALHLNGNLHVTSPGPHYGNIDIEFLNDPNKIVDIAGTLAGYVELGAA